MTFLAALFLTAGALFAQGSAGIPKHDGWVTDLADLLPAERERALEERMESFRAGSSGAEIAVLTVPSLNGEPLETFALETGRAWGIGSPATQRGALLVVARAEREVRIEVGRGLEGLIPDAIAWRVIQEVIVPKFKGGDFPGGIEAGVLALHRAVGGDYGALGGSPRSGPSAAPLMFPFAMAVLVIAIAVARRGRGGGRGPFGGTGLPYGLGGLAGLGGLRGGLGGSGGFRGGGGFGGFGGGGGFSGGGASGRW